MSDGHEADSWPNRAVFESALNAMALFDDDGICRDANPAFCALMGETRASLIGNHFRTFLADPTQLADLPAHLATRTTLRGELQLRRRDGAPVAVEYSLVLGAGPQRHLVILHDVTRHHQMETELQQVNAELARKARDLASLQEIGVQLSRSLELETIYTVLQHEVVGAFLGADHAILALAEPVTGTLRYVCGWLNGELCDLSGLPPASADESTRCWLDSLPAPRVESPSYVLRDLPQELVEGLDPPPRSALCVPLVARDQVLGVLGVVAGEEGQLERADLALVTALSRMIGVAIANAQMVVRLQEEITERTQAQAEVLRTRREEEEFAGLLTRLVRLGNRLAMTTGEVELCRAAVELGRAELGFERMSIWLVDEDPDWVRGTYGTDEQGQLRDERAERSLISEHETLVYFMQHPHVPLKYHRSVLRNHLREVVGTGTVGAAALWSGTQVIGMMNVDNLLTGSEIPAYRWHLLELYAALVGHLLVLKRAEGALRRNEALLRRVLNLLPVGVTLLGPDRRVVRTNPAAQGIWGTGFELGGEWANPRGWWLGNGKPVGEDEWPGARALATGEPVLNQEFEIERADGTRRIILGSALPLRDESGAITGAVKVDQDLTERRRRELEIASLAARLQTVVDAVDFGLVLLDEDQRVILANRQGRAQLEILGERDAGERLVRLAGHPLSYFRRSDTPTPRRSRLERSPWSAPEQDSSVVEVVVEGRTYEISMAPVHSTDLRAGWMLVLDDVTEERAVHEGIRRHDRLAAVGRLAAGIAHDFNNVLAAIILYSQMVLRTPMLDEVNRNRLMVIREQAQRAGQLVRQILDFSRQTVVERKPVDLLPLVKEMVKLWQRTLPESIEFRIETGEEEDYRVAADAASLQQVLTNLVINAHDAMPNGGEIAIVLRRVTADNEEAAADAPHGWVNLVVRDTGSGIDPEVLPHIFEPFFTTKPVGKGTGLGLAQVYGIVQQHGGTISAQSRLGEGTTISILLPALPAGEPGVESDDFVEGLPGQSASVLLVEDNAAAREATAAILEMLGYRVIQASDGEEGLARFQAEADRIALVVSDLVMPNLGGTALLTRIRELRPDMRILITTGYPMEESVREWLEAGQVEWLQKPFSVRDLTEKVRILRSDGRDG